MPFLHIKYFMVKKRKKNGPGVVAQWVKSSPYMHWDFMWVPLCLGDLEQAPGFWLWIGSVPAIVAIWGVEDKGGRYLCLSFSAFQLKKSSTKNKTKKTFHH